MTLQATLPASDLQRAIAWYEKTLGLTPTEVDEETGGATYGTGDARFLVYASEFAGTNKATAASITVGIDEFDSKIAELREAGVEFHDLEFGDMKTVDGVMTTPDGNKVAWFTDSEGNILGIGTM